VNHHVCPVCDTALHVAQTGEIAISTQRGSRAWMRCRDCAAYFDTDEYLPDHEIVHTRTQPWGGIESGIQLNGFKDRMFSSVLRRIRIFADEGSSLLDIGCSFGGFLLRAKEAGYKVRGVDILPEAVQHVLGNGIPCEAAMSVADVGVPDGSLDIISVLDCNYYWPNQSRELRAVRAKLRPGGLLAMRVVDKSWMLTIGLFLRRWVPSFGSKLCQTAVNDHHVSIPVRSYLRLLRKEGFDILYASPRGAMHSDRSRLPVKLCFATGYLIWLLTRRYLAPGCLILARRMPS